MTDMANRGDPIELLNLKVGSFAWNSSLKLKCGGEICTCKSFALAKMVLACITESCE